MFGVMRFVLSYHTSEYLKIATKRLDFHRCSDAPGNPPKTTKRMILIVFGVLIPQNVQNKNETQGCLSFFVF